MTTVAASPEAAARRKARSAKNYAARRDAILARQKERAKLPAVKAARRAAHAKWRSSPQGKAYLETHKSTPEKTAEYGRRWRANNPGYIRQRAAQEARRCASGHASMGVKSSG